MLPVTADPHAAKRAVAALRLAAYEAELTAALHRTLRAQKADTLAQVRTQTASLFVAPDGTSLADRLAEAARTAASSVYAKILAQIDKLWPQVTLPEYDLTGRLERLDYLVGELGADTIASIGETLTAGANLGEGIPDLAKRIQDVYDVSDSRAETIARTEVVGSSNSMAFDQAGAAQDLLGVPLTKSWLATADERTRPDHAEADGQEQPLEEPFDVGGEDLMYPGDPEGSPEQVVNCRCALLTSDGSEQDSEEG